MAKITTSALIDSISGKVGNVVFRGSELGRHVYLDGTRKKKPTPYQLLVQSAVSQVRRAWQDLSTEDRDSWNQLALLVRTDRGFNGQYPRRAYSLFHAMNFWPAYCGVTMVYTAPSWPLTKAETFAYSNITSAGLFGWYTALQTGAADGLAIFKVAPCMTINQRSKFITPRIVGFRANSVGVFSPITTFPDHFPSPIIGQQFRLVTVSWSSLGFPYSYQDQIKTVEV